MLLNSMKRIHRTAGEILKGIRLGERGVVDVAGPREAMDRSMIAVHSSISLAAYLPHHSNNDKDYYEHTEAERNVLFG